MSISAVIREALAAGEGAVRLAPCWVPRTFLEPGGRLKLDARDRYALGAQRGGIGERWLASTTRAGNGPGTPEDEGLSAMVGNGRKVPLRDAIETLGDEFLGAEVMREQGGWSVLAKLCDHLGPAPHHMHAMPEACYYPPQYGSTAGDFPYTFLGLNPGTTREDVRRCLERWNEGDNGLLYHSRAYKQQPGTGWQIAAGLLHAPGSMPAYELGVNSDAASVFQSMVEGRALPRDLLVRDVPEEHRQDLEYILGMLDWEANVDPVIAEHRRLHPQPVLPEDVMADCGYSEKWIACSTPQYSAKELTVLPSRSAFVRDAAAYGAIVIQGWGTIGRLEVETPTVIRYAQMTKDELFVTAAAARSGVVVRNRSDKEDLVILKHFGAGNPDTGGAGPRHGNAGQGRRLGVG